MTRTTKANDIPHNNPEAAILMVESNVPKFFAKNGFVDTAPSKTKKDGGGKGNWGQPGDEIEDLDEFNMTRPRRYSNSSSPTQKFELKNKFEVHEEEPLYEEDRHGPTAEDRAAGDAPVNGTVTGTVTTNGTTTANDTVAAGSSGSGEAFRP
ncbi:hypothetical protein Dda_0490 [Drechslerella dactyloides]|uniref:Hyaluronan/mRNA-binding protein domain-containing protein n=1 Tax=Drechslerella dactyloides TaxID=74499 RepID=A0AAD6J6M3_DREDA|nr:hypothetical protein Dda_0490 [Drechslerella dactyloides]